MADLFDRLFLVDPDTENVAVHYFRAAIGDYVAGYTTRQQIIDWWELGAAAQADLAVLCDDLDSRTVLERAVRLIEIHDVLLFVEAGAKYTTKTSFKNRLGL